METAVIYDQSIRDSGRILVGMKVFPSSVGLVSAQNTQCSILTLKLSE